MKKIKRSISILLIAMMALAMLEDVEITAHQETVQQMVIVQSDGKDRRCRRGKRNREQSVHPWCQSDVRLVCMVWREGHRYF